MAYLIAIDQGTTSSRAILFDESCRLVDSRQREITPLYPQLGWVEEDAQEIWSGSYGVLQELLAHTGVDPKDIAGIGITNQRETTVVWEKRTGRPLYHAIVWQCRRTAERCEKIKAEGMAPTILAKTGLVIDAYFSATKLAWILDQVDPDRQRAAAGEILFGTVDSWLLWKLTDGAVHATDQTNASRTMLYNIHTLDWDEDLLDYFDIPRAILPAVYPSGYRYGQVQLGKTFVPISGIAGDQQSALFGQGCTQVGEAKNTYGTGCFLLMHTGETAVTSQHGLLTTMAASLDETPRYALEGSVFVGGAVIQWLRDELHLLTDAEDSAFFANKLTDNEGVYLVPAFVGLGAPHWDMYARGALFGLTRGTGRKHIIRAALESIAFQTRDVLEAMALDLGERPKRLRVDGGASANDFLMQFQADVLDISVERPPVLESTALGAAMLAGFTEGVWQTEQALSLNGERIFSPTMSAAQRIKNLQGWDDCLGRTLSQRSKK